MTIHDKCDIDGTCARANSLSQALRGKPMKPTNQRRSRAGLMRTSWSS